MKAKPIQNFVTGFRAIFTGMRLIANNPEIRKMAVFPFIVGVYLLINLVAPPKSTPS